MTKQMLIGLLAYSLATFTLNASAAGDPVAGKLSAETCMGCHAIQGYFNVYPTYRVPMVGGQSVGYLESALKAYRDGGRQHPTMNANAAALSDDDIANIAAYFAGLNH